MVSGVLKNPRNFIPILGILALLAMFFKLPEAASLLGAAKCPTCPLGSPYVPLIGGAYFSVLIAVSLLFPSFPAPQIARGGLLWAVLLFISLTYLHLPGVCVLCWLGHLCHIAIWAIWMSAAAKQESSLARPLKERLFLTLLAPMVVAALFSSLNLTLLIYGLSKSKNHLANGFKAGDSIPPFSAKTHLGHSITHEDLASANVVLNFVTPGCVFCKEQLAILKASNSAFRFINVSRALSADMIEQMPSAEWVEDREGLLSVLFKVEGYPTLFVLGESDKVVDVIPGVSDQLTAFLSSNE